MLRGWHPSTTAGNWESGTRNFGAADNPLDIGIGSLAIAIAVISNTVVKGGIALVAGGRGFGKDIAKIFSLSILVGAIVALRVLIW